MNQALALLVGLPLFMAPLLAMTSKRVVAWSLLSGTLLVMLGLAVWVAFGVLAGGAVAVDMGNWAPPFGIEYRADGLNILVVLLIVAMAVLLLPMLLPQELHDVEAEKQPAFYAVFLLCVTGLLGMTASHDIFNIYVFLEIASLATYTLIALGRNKKAPLAGFEYLMLGSIGATFLLIGIGFLYMATGTLNLTDLGTLLRPLAGNRLVEVGLGFIVLGLLLKSAVFPLHIWLVQSYTLAPTAVATFLAATATKVALYLLLRILYGLFVWHPVVGQFLLVLALGAVLFGSVAACFQQEVKRILAFSSVAQIGLIVMGIGLGTSAGLAAALFTLLMHAPAKACLFMAAFVVERQRGGSRIEDFSGTARAMPLLFATTLVAALSLVGIPLTAGFLSKWLLLNALLQAGYWPLLVAVLVSSLLSLAYLYRVIEPMWFGPAVIEVRQRGQGPWYLLLPMVVLALACSYFGIFGEGVMQFAQQASNLYFRAGE